MAGGIGIPRKPIKKQPKPYHGSGPTPRVDPNIKIVDNKKFLYGLYQTYKMRQEEWNALSTDSPDWDSALDAVATAKVLLDAEIKKYGEKYGFSEQEALALEKQEESYVYNKKSSDSLIGSMEAERIPEGRDQFLKHPEKKALNDYETLKAWQGPYASALPAVEWALKQNPDYTAKQYGGEYQDQPNFYEGEPSSMDNTLFSKIKSDTAMAPTGPQDLQQSVTGFGGEPSRLDELTGDGTQQAIEGFNKLDPNPKSKYNPLDGPVAGESLTGTPGNAKWEKPPQFADPQDAAEMVWDQLTKPKMTRQLIGMFKVGGSVESITRTILFAGFQAGKWTPDVAMLIAMPVAMMIATLAKSAGISNIPLRMNGADKDLDKEGLKEFAGIKAKQDIGTPEKRKEDMVKSLMAGE